MEFLTIKQRKNKNKNYRQQCVCVHCQQKLATPHTRGRCAPPEKRNPNLPMKESVKFLENTSLFSGEWKMKFCSAESADN